MRSTALVCSSSIALWEENSLSEEVQFTEESQWDLGPYMLLCHNPAPVLTNVMAYTFWTLLPSKTFLTWSNLFFSVLYKADLIIILILQRREQRLKKKKKDEQLAQNLLDKNGRF